MIDPLVRVAAATDVAAIAELEAMARGTLTERRGGPRWLATHPPHHGVAAAGARTWVATIDDVVVGYLVVDVGSDPAVVLDVFVQPEAREIGFGDALLAAALDDARAAGATMLEAEALPGDRDTKNLYERAGITARLITVSTPL